jgi:hypothetical protein
MQPFDMSINNQFWIHVPVLNLGLLSTHLSIKSDKRSKGRFEPFDLTLELFCALIEVYTLPFGFSRFIGGGHLALDASSTEWSGMN